MLTDINSDFGMGDAPFVVVGVSALLNFIKNLFRTSVGSDRFVYIPMGLDIERTLQEPPSPEGANIIFMIIQNAVQQYLDNVTLDLSRSHVIAVNNEHGSYEILIVLNEDTIHFYI